MEDIYTLKEARVSVIKAQYTHYLEAANGHILAYFTSYEIGLLVVNCLNRDTRRILRKHFERKD